MSLGNIILLIILIVVLVFISMYITHSNKKYEGMTIGCDRQDCINLCEKTFGYGATCSCGIKDGKCYISKLISLPK